MPFHFDDYTLDAGRRLLCRNGTAVHVEPQVFDLILHLVRNRDRVVSKDDLLAHVWGGRIVSESTLSNRINAARCALDDSGERQKYILTVARRGVRFVGEVREDGFDSSPAAAARGIAAVGESAMPAAVRQEVTFCQTPDGVRLAVAASGDGRPVVKTPNWLNHVEFDWQNPVWAPLTARLSEKFRLIRYDERGNGLSDWDVADISFEAFVRDLETVVDALGLGRFALFGFSHGAAVSIAYAARHPERVSRLVLSGGYAQGWGKRSKGEQAAQFEALSTLVGTGWAEDNPAFRQVFTSLYIPDATDEQMQWVNNLQNVAASPENTVRLIRALGNVDVAELLPRVAAPTLVLHSRGNTPVPLEQGLVLARSIPNARLVALESNNHIILSHEPAWDRYMNEICEFLDADDPRVPAGR